MPKFLEKIKDFFSGKFVCKVKRPAHPESKEGPEPPQEEQKTEESKTEENSPF